VKCLTQHGIHNSIGDEPGNIFTQKRRLFPYLARPGHGALSISGLPSGDLRQFALLAWSMVHGVAKLATAKRLPYESTGDVLKFAKFVIDESLPVRGEVRRSEWNSSRLCFGSLGMACW
jgi:hypothetical protein